MSQPSTLLTARTAIMVVYAAFGSAVGALAGAMPEVIRTIEIDDVSLGLAMALSTLATVAAMSLGGRIAHAMSNRAVLLSGLPLFAVLLFGLLAATSQAAFFAAFILLGLLFGLTDLFMNAEGTAIEHDMKRPVFTMFHASVSAATALFAVASSFVAVMAGPWLVGVMSMVTFALAWGLVFRSVPARPLVARRLPAGIGSAWCSWDSRPASSSQPKLRHCCGLPSCSTILHLHLPPSPGWEPPSTACATRRCVSSATVCVRALATFAS